jgi:TolB-like protein/tetratricopeptide (TPR) repeat protein
MSKRGYRFAAEVREEEDVRPEPSRGPQTADDGDEASVSPESPEAPAGLSPGPSPSPAPAVVGAHARAWRKKAALLACAMLGLTAAAAIFQQGVWERTTEAPKSVAVLPFKIIGATSETELLGMGMADTLSLKLGGLRRTTVLPSTSVFKYAGRDGDAAAAGRELGVDAVLDGTVQRAGPRLRVTVRLIGSEDGQTIWAGQFDETSSDVFSLQDSISEQIVYALARHVGGTGDGAAVALKRPTGDEEAYQRYLLGLYLRHKMSPDALSDAVAHFQQAVGRDPRFALAYAGMADAYSQIAALRHPPLVPSEAWEKARAAATRAVELDDQTAEAYTVLAWYEANVKSDYEEAGRLHLRALSLKPNHAAGHARYAGLLLLTGATLEQVVERLRRAQELDPTSVEPNMVLAYMLELARRDDEAIHYSRRALDIDPTDVNAQEVLGLAYAHAGRCDESVGVFRRLRPHRTRPTLHLAGTAYALAFNGRRAEAETVLAELTERTDGGEQDEPYYMAGVYAALGRRDEAFGWLERIRRPVPELLAHSRTLDPLRGDPQFADFIKRRTGRPQ